MSRIDRQLKLISKEEENCPNGGRVILSTAPSKYIPKIQFTQDTIDGLTKNKTKNVLVNETVILSDIVGDPISHCLRN